MSEWAPFIALGLAILIGPAAVAFAVLYLAVRGREPLSQMRIVSLVGAACGVLGAIGIEPALRGPSEDPLAVIFVLLLPIVLTWLPPLLLLLRGERRGARNFAADLLKLDGALAVFAMLGLLVLGLMATDFDAYFQDVALLMIAGWVVMAVSAIALLANRRIERDEAPEPVLRPTI